MGRLIGFGCVAGLACLALAGRRDRGQRERWRRRRHAARDQGRRHAQGPRRQRPPDRRPRRRRADRRQGRRRAARRRRARLLQHARRRRAARRPGATGSTPATAATTRSTAAPATTSRSSTRVEDGVYDCEKVQGAVIGRRPTTPRGSPAASSPTRREAERLESERPRRVPAPARLPRPHRGARRASPGWRACCPPRRWSPRPRSGRRKAPFPKPRDLPIDTFVVLMMENRSFDHYFGWHPKADGAQRRALLPEPRRLADVRDPPPDPRLPGL